MRTVLVANRKGGVGKTLISVTIASALAQAGERVALADADKQLSSLGWLARRPMTVPQMRGLDWTKGKTIGECPKTVDWLVIDAPGSLKGSKAEALIAEAKAILVPVQPSVFDENATRGFLADIEELKRIRKGKTVVSLIANRVRPRSRASEVLDDFLAEVGYSPLATITERAIYSDLAAQGLSIFDRNLASLRQVKDQWAPILAEISA